MPQIIEVDASKPLSEAVSAVRAPLIIVIGAVADNCRNTIASILQRAVIPAAAEVGAAIVDDAKLSGCASALAAAARDQLRPVRLVGIIPHGRVENEVEPNHEEVLRLPETWPTPRGMFQVADELKNEKEANDRVVVVLFGGGEGEKSFLVQCARQCWPVIVVSKTGGLADQIDAANSTTPPANLPDDSNFIEVVQTGRLFVTPVDKGADVFQSQILAQLDKKTAAATLAQAWERFDDMDQTALREQNLFQNIEGTLIVLAVISVALSISSQVFGINVLHKSLHYSVIVVPIIIAIVGAYNSHFRDGLKWIVSRGSAEQLKSEIFRFRAKAGDYSDEQCSDVSRESKLASKMADIVSAWQQSEVNKTSIERLKGRAAMAHPSGFLSPAQYIDERLKDQIAYFVKKTRRLSSQLIRRQVTVYVLGGVGTLLAALGHDVWVALATAAATAFTTKLQADQTEPSLTRYNQTLASLLNILAWWDALSIWQKTRPTNRNVLVEQAEKALGAETAGWVQQMQSALDKLTEKESDAQSQ